MQKMNSCNCAFQVPDGIPRFANINISQGRVATHLRWDGIFINNFIANFQLSTSVKELQQEPCYRKDDRAMRPIYYKAISYSP